jgi:hypothetical protein
LAKENSRRQILYAPTEADTFTCCQPRP